MKARYTRNLYLSGNRRSWGKRGSLGHRIGETLKMQEHKTITKIDYQKEFFKNFKIGQLTNEQKEQLTNMVLRYNDMCMYGEKPLKQTSVVKHRINLKKEVPDDKKKLKAYRENEENQKIIQQEVANMLKAGIIRESYNLWSSLVVLVGKKSGKKRFCIDYRKLNTNTKIDAYQYQELMIY